MKKVIIFLMFSVIVLSDNIKFNIKVTPHYFEKITNEENLVYCSSFQLAWNVLIAEIAKEEIKLENQPEMVNYLNKKMFTKDDIDENTYLVKTGKLDEQFVKSIKEEVKIKFNDKIEFNEFSNNDILIFSYLKKILKFENDYEEINPLKFREGNRNINVKGFGLNKQNFENFSKQIEILDYINNDDFVIELKTNDKNEELILAKIQPKDNIYDTINFINKRIDKTEKNNRIKYNEPLIIPEIFLEAKSNFETLNKKEFFNKKLKEFEIAENQQIIKFHLNKSGVEIKSHATIGSNRSPLIEREFIFNKPFLVMIRKKGSKLPYLFLWINNTDCLVKSKKEDFYLEIIRFIRKYTLRSRIGNVYPRKHYNYDIDKKDSYGMNAILYFSKLSPFTYEFDWFIKDGVDLNVKNNEGNTPLHHSIKNNSLSTFINLVENGADLNIRNKNNISALELIKSDKNSHIYKWYFNRFNKDKVGKNKKYFEMLNIYKIIKGSDLSELKEIIKNSGNINKRYSNGLTLLNLSVIKNNYDFVKYLLENGADPNIGDKSNWIPIFSSIIQQNDKITEILIDKSDLNIKEKKGKKALDFAFEFENKKIIDMFMNKKMIINNNYKSYYSDTNYFETDIIGNILEDENWELIDTYLSFKPNLEIYYIDERRRRKEDSLIEKVVRKNDLSLLKKFEKNGMKLDGRYGYLGIEEACKQGNLEIIKYIESKGLKLKKAIKYNVHLLNAACIKGDIKIVNYLIKKKVKINYKEKALIPILWYRKIKNIKNVYEFPPLHYALLNKHIEIIKLLIKKGANVNYSRGYSLREIPGYAYESHFKDKEILNYKEFRNTNINRWKNNDMIIKILLKNGYKPKHLDRYYNEYFYRFVFLSEDLELIKLVIEKKVNLFKEFDNDFFYYVKDKKIFNYLLKNEITINRNNIEKVLFNRILNRDIMSYKKLISNKKNEKLLKNRINDIESNIFSKVIKIYNEMHYFKTNNLEKSDFDNKSEFENYYKFLKEIILTFENYHKNKNDIKILNSAINGYRYYNGDNLNKREVEQKFCYDERLVERLVKKNYNLNIGEINNFPLYIAIKNQNYNFVKLLLEYGADPFYGNTDKSLLELAIKIGNKEIIDLLVKNINENSIK